jgi:hypothetical protein
MRPYLEKNLSQKRAGGVVQGIGPEFKPQYYKKKKKNGFIHWSILNVRAFVNQETARMARTMYVHMNK